MTFYFLQLSKDDIRTTFCLFGYKAIHKQMTKDFCHSVKTRKQKEKACDKKNDRQINQQIFAIISHLQGLSTWCQNKSHAVGVVVPGGTFKKDCGFYYMTSDL